MLTDEQLKRIGEISSELYFMSKGVMLRKTTTPIDYTTRNLLDIAWEAIDALREIYDDLPF